MLIPNYTAPRSSIYQFREVLVNEADDSKGLLIVGPKYNIHDTNVDGKDPDVIYTGLKDNYPLNGLGGTDVIDKDSSTIYCEDGKVWFSSPITTLSTVYNLKSNVGQAKGFNQVVLTDAAGVPDTGTLYVNVGVSSPYTLLPFLNGINIVQGDKIAFDYDNQGVIVTQEATVTGLIPFRVDTTTNNLTSGAKLTSPDFFTYYNLTAAIDAAGSGYLVGDSVKVNNTYFTVTAITSTGLISSFSPTLFFADDDSAFTGTSKAVTGGTGTGATILFTSLALNNAVLGFKILTGKEEKALSDATITILSTKLLDGRFSIKFTTDNGLYPSQEVFVNTWNGQYVTLMGDLFTFTLGLSSTAPTVGVTIKQQIGFVGTKFDNNRYIGLILDKSLFPFEIYTGLIPLPTEVYVYKTFNGFVDKYLDGKQNWWFGHNNDPLNEPQKLVLADGIWLNSQIKHNLFGFQNYPLFGKFFFTVRACAQRTSSLIITINGETEGLKDVGANDMRNPLGFSVYQALGITDERTVYLIQTNGETAADYEDALSYTESTDKIAFILFLTDALTAGIVETLLLHSSKMSRHDNMQWRVVYMPMAAPSIIENKTLLPIHVLTTQDNDGEWTVFNSSTDLSILNLEVGDTVRYLFSTDIFGKEVYIESAITEIIDSSSFVILKNLNINAPYAGEARFFKAASGKNVTILLKDISRRLGGADNLRCRLSVVFCDNPIIRVLDANGHYANVLFPNYLLNAFYTGLRLFNAPHKPLTRYAINCFDSCPNMYTKYKRLDLDAILAQGICIITQDLEGQTPYVRHQLTLLASDKGPLYNEQSCITNYDNICYGIKNVVETFTGKRNNDPLTLIKLKTRIEEVLLGFTNTILDNDLDRSAGFQLLQFDDNRGGINSVYMLVNPKQRDRTICRVNLIVPVPNNGTDVYTYASTWDGTNVIGATQFLDVDVETITE